MSKEPTTLRHFAIELYAKPGVSEACLLVQDECRVNVNLLLFAAWMGAYRGLGLSGDDIASVNEAAAPWHSEIVLPLRQVRRRLKSGPAPAPCESTQHLRSGVQRLEIDAELLELDMLEQLGNALLAATDTGAPDKAFAGMKTVVQEAAGRPLSEAELSAIERIASAIGHGNAPQKEIEAE